jgi:hypothetical protein
LGAPTKTATAFSHGIQWWFGYLWINDRLVRTRLVQRASDVAVEAKNL